MSYSKAVRNLGVESTHMSIWFHNFGNSGACAIGLAIAGGASRIVLLGYDCQQIEGKTHWHGDHPKALSNAVSIKRWPAQFANVATAAQNKGVTVINASRATALKCFERQALENAI